jgi:DNA/RNA endonuclease YhcR with UshA esterase domain
MEDEYIFKIAIVTSIIGLVGMSIFAVQIAPRDVKIIDINRVMLDEDVSIEGVVVDLTVSPNSNTYFLKIMDGTGNLSVVVFDKTVNDLRKNNITMQNFSKRKVKIIGTVTEYEGSLELVLKDAKSIHVMA